MRHLLTILAVLAITGAATGATVLETGVPHFDAANLNLDGTPAPDQFRLVLDNTDGTEPMTGVTFGVTIYEAIVNLTRLANDDPRNLWAGNVGGQYVFWVPAGRVITGTATTHTQVLPSYTLDPTPENDDDFLNDTVAFGAVYPGTYFDYVALGVTIHSPAVAEVIIDGITTQLIDDNPYPQMAPEPATLSLLGCGLVALFRRRNTWTK